MRVPKATRAVPSEIEFETPGATVPATSSKMEKASARYPSDDSEAFRSSNSVGSNRDGAGPYQYDEEERQSAIDDISLTGDTAPSSVSFIHQAIVPNAGSALNDAVTAKATVPLPIQHLNALARNHLRGCGGLPIGLMADDEHVKNMRVGVGIAGNVAGRAAKNAPGGKKVIHGVKAGLAYAEETAQSAKKLISDTKQLARGMDIKNFAASSASWSFEDDMFRLSGETNGQSDYGSGSKSNSSKSFRYTESDETSYYSKDDTFDMGTMQSSFGTEHASCIYTASAAPSVAEDLSLAPQSREQKKLSKARERVVPEKDYEATISRRQVRVHGPTNISTEGPISGATTDVNSGGDDADSEYTEVTYQSETNYVDLRARGNKEEKETVEVDGDGESSEYTEVICPSDNNGGTNCIDNGENGKTPVGTEPQKDDKKNRGDHVDKFSSEPNILPTIAIVHSRSPEEILADNTNDIIPVKIKWIDPSPELASLIAAVLSTSLSRRSNACGTIKMMASNKKKGAALARTRILVDALILAINDGNQMGNEKDLHLEAQNRATMAVLNLSEVKANRVLLAQHPGLVKALIDLIGKDKGETRAAACRSLVMMSKMQQNKVPLVEADGFVSLLADIMSGRHDQRDMSDARGGTSSSLSSMNSISNGGSQNQSWDNSLRDENIKKANDSASRGSMAMRQCKSARYQEYLSLARVNCCAAFSHLAKDCASSAVLCKDKAFMGAIISLCSDTRSPLYRRCLEILAHLTRFSGNNETLASNSKVINILVTSGGVKGLKERHFALRSIQNISAVCAESRMILATDSTLSVLLSVAFEGTQEEQDIALGTIFNLALEPDTLVNLTNTKNFTAVMIHVINHAGPSPASCQIARQILRLVANWMNTLADTNHSAHQIVVGPTGWMLYS